MIFQKSYKIRSTKLYKIDNCLCPRKKVDKIPKWWTWIRDGFCYSPTHDWDGNIEQIKHGETWIVKTIFDRI